MTNKQKTAITVLLILVVIEAIFIVAFLIIFNVSVKTNLASSNYFGFTANTNSFDTCQLNNLSFFIPSEAESMYPSFNANSLLLYAANTSNISIGDIVIAYIPSINQTFAHRVIKIENGDYLIKGDNQVLSSGIWVNQSQIYGKVVGVLY